MDDVKKAAADLAARRRTPLTDEQKDRWAAVEAATRNGASTEEIAAVIMRSGLSNEEVQRFLTELQNSQGFVIYERR
jgi:hypothetical protein